MESSSIRAVAYANYPNVALHRAVMRALLDNRARGAKLRLSLTEIVSAVERLGVPATADQVAGSLHELEELKVVDSMQSFERVRTAAELRLNHFSYDVTGLGERIEQFFDELAGLVEAVGSLDANRLARIRALLARLVEHRSLDPRELQSTFTELHAQFEDLRAGAAQFMRELSATMASTEAIDEGTFADYKRKVADYLSGFWRELGQHADAIAAHVATVDAEREPLLRAVASLSVAPHPSLSDAEVLERQLALLRRQWAEISAWFGAGDSQLRSLDTHLHAAIDWILRGVRRLRERRVQRVNRSSEYRALAAMFAGADSESDCHAIFAAAFGLHGARHMSVPEIDPDVVSPGESWWDAPFAPVQGFLRRPGRGEVAAGRPAPIADAREAQALAVEEELRRRSLVGELLDRLPDDPARLSEMPALDEESFDLLLDALGMAVATGAVGYSDDGTLRLTVLDMGDSLPPALVQVGDGGVLETPDLLVQVGRA